MGRTEIKRVKIYGKLYHLVVGKVKQDTLDKRWRKEVLLSSSFSSAPEGEYDYHHIGGRVGCLRWIVENGIMIPRHLHILEKSTSHDDRVKFHHKIQKLVGKKKFGEILRIKNWYKYQGNGRDMPPKEA